jgi:hypothetical protein
MTIILYQDEAERRQHLLAIQYLASETKSSEEVIRPLYESILLRLKKEATVKLFLTIMVSRKVKAILQERTG